MMISKSKIECDNTKPIGLYVPEVAITNELSQVLVNVAPMMLVLGVEYITTLLLCMVVGSEDRAAYDAECTTIIEARIQ